MSKKLLINDGRSERELLLVANLVVGRDPVCDISGDHSLLSRRHAEFVVDPTSVVVRDLGSRNGVFVNGVKTAAVQLQPGDLVRVGHFEMRYVEDNLSLSSAAEGVDLTAAVFPMTATPASAAAVTVDDEGTRVVRPPAPRVPLTAPDVDGTRVIVMPPSNGRVASGGAIEEEFTRVVRPPTPVPVSRPPTTAASVSAERPDATGILQATPVTARPASDHGRQEQASALEATSRPVLSAKVASQPESSGRLPSLVFPTLTLLAVFAAVAAAVPFAQWQGRPFAGEGLWWLAGSAALVLAAIYGLGLRLIARLRVEIATSARTDR